MQDATLLESILLVTFGGAVLLLAMLVSNAHGSVNLRPIPQLSTPAEVGRAVLDEQIQEMLDTGYNNQCLMDVEVSGESCIEHCVSKNAPGFFLAIYFQHPQCKVIGCMCEEALGLEEAGVVQ